MHTLNEIMAFDHVVLVRPDGTVDEKPQNAPWAPDYADDYIDGHPRWTVMTHGWSRQCGYSGPVMHNSEYIGGALERFILETPGWWVAVPAQWWNADEQEYDIEGWVLFHSEVSDDDRR